MVKKAQIVIFILLLCTLVISETPNTHSQQQQQHHSQLRQSTNNHHRPRSHNHNNQQHHHYHHHKHLSQNQRQNRKLSTNEPLNAIHPDTEVELLDKLPTQSTTNNKNTNTTLLRRLTARDYYNNVVQRRLNRNGISSHGNRNAVNSHDWNYNTYNVKTNTYGPPQPTYYDTSKNGKGDDNTADVEFVENSASNINHEWSAPPRRSYDYTTHAPLPTKKTVLIPQNTVSPPPLVPARRGYVTPATDTDRKGAHSTTESPLESNTISSKNIPHDMER